MPCGLAGQCTAAALASVLMIHAITPHSHDTLMQHSLTQLYQSRAAYHLGWEVTQYYITAECPKFWLRQPWLTSPYSEASRLSDFVHLLPWWKQVTRVVVFSWNWTHCLCTCRGDSHLKTLTIQTQENAMCL